MRSEGNLAVDRETARENARERNDAAARDAVRGQESTQKRNVALTDESHEDWKERYTRLRADFENYKRHAEAQREELAGIGKEKVLEDVFPVVEHMERAIKATKDAGDQSGILEGIEMVYQEMLRVLEKNGVERIDTVGEPFDPEVHEAVAVITHADCPEDTVVEEVRAGFMKNGKLLRPASVVVAQ
jgi:molecular chaperone GrpE